MREVTLEEMLSTREERVLRQREFLSLYNCPLVCFTMNIAGPVKHSPIIERAFYEGVRLLKASLSEKKIKACQIEVCHTGCEMLLAIDEDCVFLKELCTKIEEASPLATPHWQWCHHVTVNNPAEINCHAPKGHSCL